MDKKQNLENPETINQEWKGQKGANPSRIKDNAQDQSIKNERMGLKGDAQGSSEEPVADEHYDLISVLYHSLQACETYQKYCDDAEQKGDQDLVDFFEEVIQQNRQCASRAMQLLSSRAQGQGAIAQQGVKQQQDVGASRH